jgi:protein O-GlcNAc transferase
MGVPLVVLAGTSHVSRVGVSLLSNIGLAKLVAASADEYLSIAAELAKNGSERRELRATLRGRMAASPLTDGAACARALEDAYRTMWRNWCMRQVVD